MSASNHRSVRSLWKRSLRIALIVIACIASYVIGHRHGFHVGYGKAAMEYGDEDFRGAYDVTDLVPPLLDLAD